MAKTIGLDNQAAYIWAKRQSEIDEIRRNNLWDGFLTNNIIESGATDLEVYTEALVMASYKMHGSGESMLIGRINTDVSEKEFNLWLTNCHKYLVKSIARGRKWPQTLRF